MKQLIKYIGNKNRYAKRIISYFPIEYETYYEPFMGSGAVLSHLSPMKGIASDNYKPLIDLYKLVKTNPKIVSESYKKRWKKYIKNKEEAYAFTDNDVQLLISDLEGKEFKLTRSRGDVYVD